MKKRIEQAIPHLSENWKEKYHLLLEEDNLLLLEKHLRNYRQSPESYQNRAPFFQEELESAVEHDMVILLDLDQKSKDYSLDSKAFAQVFEQVPIASILTAMGQRLTPASIQDERAIPPTREKVLDSCKAPFNAQISQGVRAWQKHEHRFPDRFWGEVSGNNQEKETLVEAHIIKVLDTYTWWNVFCHYEHDLVYEIRVASGYGIRWKQNDLTLIGFLGPFL